MGSARWHGMAVAGALALFVSALAWGAGASADDRYQGAAHYEGYGPIEDQLDVNNPPVPGPSGRSSCGTISPASPTRCEKWPAFFRDLELDLHLRSYYFNRELPIRPAPPSGPDTVNQEAWALGGWMTLESGWLLDFFRVGATGYMSQPAYAPDTRDGTGLLGPGQTSITVPGQAWAQLRYQNYALLTGYRQLVNQGWVNPQDNRMIPNTFEGVTLTGDVGPGGVLRRVPDRDEAAKLRHLHQHGQRCRGHDRGEPRVDPDEPELRSRQGTPEPRAAQGAGCLPRKLLRARRHQHAVSEPGVRARPHRRLARAIRRPVVRPAERGLTADREHSPRGTWAPAWRWAGAGSPSWR